MTARSNIHLARQAAAEIHDAECKYLGVWWSEQEAAHSSAPSPRAAAAAAKPALGLCGLCTQTNLCAVRAELDAYTGLAAGTVYVNGRRMQPNHVMRHPTPPQKLPEAG